MEGGSKLVLPYKRPGHAFGWFYKR